MIRSWIERLLLAGIVLFALGSLTWALTRPEVHWSRTGACVRVVPAEAGDCRNLPVIYTPISVP